MKVRQNLKIIPIDEEKKPAAHAVQTVDPDLTDIIRIMPV